MEIQPSDSIKSIKDKIWERTAGGNPEEEQHMILVYAGVQLEDGHMISQYKIPNDSAVHCVIRDNPKSITSVNQPILFQLTI